MQNPLQLDQAGREKLAMWLIILTGLMAAVVMLFSYCLGTEFVDHPQFSYIQEYARIKDRISERSGALFFYYTYFFLDMIWAPMLLLLVYNMTQKFMNVRWFLNILLIVSTAAYAFDLLEGIGYLFNANLFGNTSFSLDQFISIKTGFYTIAFFLLLIAIYQWYFTDNLRLIGQGIMASFLSIIIIVLILFLATKLEQGSTVIVHLMESPFSIFICAMMVFILALVCAHYPDYIRKYFFPHSNSTTQWFRADAGVFTSLLGMGIIYYNDPKADISELAKKETRIADLFRKNLGGALLFTWIYSLLFVLDKYMAVKLPIGLICFGLIILYLYIYFGCYRKLNEPSEKNTTLIKNTIKAFIVFLFLLLLTLLSSLFLNWILTCFLLILSAISNMLFYIYFQFSRSDFIRENGIHPLLAVGDIVPYLKIFAFIGWCAFFIYFGFLYNPPALSSLCFMLIWLYLIYGMIVILLKHNLYYNRIKDSAALLKPHRMATFFRSYIPILGFLIIGLLIYAGRAGNGLHVLTSTPESIPSISMDTFAKNSGPKKYFLASYGGGLRATIWTMLLLNSKELEEKYFLNSTVAMSGVSGGFLGLSFYTALIKEYNDTTARAKAIDSLGKHNMLSIDISYMLGPDLIKEAIPYFNNLGKDRAAASMQEYANLIQGYASNSTDLQTDSYRSYWTKTYQKNGYMPVLIGNTTGTNHNYGVAFSLCPEGMGSIFPGAVNILDVANSTVDCKPVQNCITYLGATSTTERFPIFSPAAEIEGKGHFVDGGYFENSGLLSLKNFRDHYRGITAHDSMESTDKFILIINSKDDYIRMKLKGFLDPTSDVPSGEFGSILSTITDTDILPHAMEARCEKDLGNERFIRIYLPYKITFEDVIRIIGDEPKDPFAIDSLIQISNKKIETVLVNQYPFHVFPALARVLSEPAYEYMKAMLQHEEVQEAIARI